MKKLLLFCFLYLLLPATAPAQTALRAVQDPDTELWGFVDARGEWAIAPAFEECHPYSFSSGFRLGSVKYKGRWGCIDRKGNFVVRPVFSYGDSYLAGQHLLEGTPVGRVLYRIQDRDTGKWGFVNHLGNWAILPRYEDCHPYSFGEGFNFASVKYRGKWGCINKKGVFVVKPVFSYGDSYLAGMEWQNSPDYAAVPASQVANYTSDSPVPNQEQTALAATPATPPQAPAGNTPLPASVTPPVLTILSPKNGTGYDLDEVVIRYEAKTADGQAPEIMVSIDNEPYDMTAKGVRRAGNELRLKLSPKEGQRRIQLIAKDSRGLNSEPVYLTLQYTGQQLKPALHLLAVGVGQYDDPNIADLDHAAKDAKDVARAIAEANPAGYRSIEEPILLTDAQATAVNLKTALMQLAGSVRQDDVAVLYFSGHGAQEHDETYFLSSDAVAGNLYATAVNFNDIRTAMRILVDKHCRVLVFMDACHAGALYNTKSISRTLQFAQPGVIGFYSSTTSQQSNEAEKWQNGVFTRALLDGLDGKARDGQGNITTLELERYIKTTVDRETEGIQTPIVENNVGDFILFYR
ncbi:MAG TPA: WG repeat-containing protein [Candidatus Tidjanibacter gallistercoris]|nr:WG repeat-containing protein [Candidatus Tidjanibacter gallistercoris]